MWDAQNQTSKVQTENNGNKENIHNRCSQFGTEDNKLPLGLKHSPPRGNELNGKIHKAY
jgi:hypothetical protein